MEDTPIIEPAVSEIAIKKALMTKAELTLEVNKLLIEVSISLTTIRSEIEALDNMKLRIGQLINI